MLNRVSAAIGGTVLAVLTAAAAGCASPPSTFAARAGQAKPRKVPTGPAPVLSPAAARSALAGYAAAMGKANLRRQASLLAAAEVGGSFRLDAGSYRWTRVTDPANHDRQVLTLTGDALYIPHSGPGVAWWAARAAWRAASKPSAAPIAVYLVFARAGGTWKVVFEPQALKGHAGTFPVIATDAQGFATAVGPGTARSLAVDPAKLPALTVAAFNRHAVGPGCVRPGLCGAAARTITLTGRSALADLHDQAFWAKRLSAGSADIDWHYLTADPVYSLRAADGGAVAWFDVRAVLMLAPPPGYSFHVTIPGYYTSATERTQAKLAYVDQFAVYDPPRGRGIPHVIAAVGGPVARA